MRQYDKEFAEWAAKQNQYTIKDSVKGVPFKKGQRVLFTNDFGFTFGPFPVLGVAVKPILSGGRIFLGKDSWWFPVKPNQLKVA